jgi:pimeloyl-ACP methyl ester carboxylesterase
LRSFLACLTVALAAAGSGCYRPGPATVPLRTLEIANGAPDSHCLVVFLPGRGDTPEHFVRNGFPEELRRAGSRCAMIGVDAHLGYYFEKTVVDRLREDVIAPARARGVEEVWLVGISLGGLGSLLYTKERPGEIKGIVAIAPFLGEPTQDFAAFRSWLTGYGRPAPDHPPLFLVYGTKDRFAGPNGELAALLPDDHVFRVRGRHTWATWRRGWGAFLGSRWVPGR